MRKLVLIYLSCFVRLSITAQDSSCNKVPFVPIYTIFNPSFEFDTSVCSTGYYGSEVANYRILPGWYTPTVGEPIGYLDACSDFKISRGGVESLISGLPYSPTLFPYVPKPVPDGHGVVAFTDNAYKIYPKLDQHPYPFWKSYVATTLLQPAKKDSLYRLDFWMGFGYKSANLDTGSPPKVTLIFRGATSPYQEKITLYASEYPSIVPYGSTACLTKNSSTNAWFPLCSTLVSIDKPGWVKASFSFTAPKNFNSIAIGPTCDTIPFPAPQDGALLGNYAYFLDDLQLYEASIPPTIVSLASGSFCDNPSSPVVLQMQTASFYVGSSFQWYKDHVPLKNEKSSSIVVSGTQYGEGWYSCQVLNDSICIQSDSLLVHWIPVPSANALGSPDTTYCDRDTAYINAYQDFTTTYYWQNGSTSPVLGTTQPGTYSVLIQNACGSAKAAKTVHFEKCNYNVYVPNAFSPNDDGINDYFRIKFYQPPGNFRMSVFNRYGQRIFFTNDPSRGWDGKINDVPQPTGVYVWMIEYDEHHGPSKFQKGTVVLVR